MRKLVGALLALASAVLPPAVRGQDADLIVVDAVVHTMDAAIPRAEALAITGGEIVAVGDSVEVERMRGPATRVIDADGATVLPGLIDAHGHVLSLGRSLRILDVVGTTSSQEVADRVGEWIGDRPAGDWIVGRGWDQNDWEVKEFPDRAQLDQVAPSHPVLLSRVDGHALWVNSLALETAGLSADTPDPPGGRIVRDATGRPTGVLIDNAMQLVAEAIPQADREEEEAQLAAATERMVSLGMTGAHDMGVDRGGLELYRDWADAGRLAPRVVAYLGASRETLDWWDTEGLASVGRERTGHFRVAGVKFYADGALGSRGAALLAPYADDPGNVGLLVTEPDTLEARVARAMRDGLQPAIHAIGDRGNRAALDAIEAAGRADLRPRIEHVQVVAPEDIPRFAELGVIASFQPTHATSDMYWAEDRVGPERIRGAYAWRTLRDSGARLACGSDFPVESANPFYGIYAAVTRQDREGWPEGGWRPAERMTREEALACFTRDAAWAAGMEDEVGSITVGKHGDFVIVDADPLTAPAEDLWKIRVLRTVIGGETMYEAGR